MRRGRPWRGAATGTRRRRTGRRTSRAGRSPRAGRAPGDRRASREHRLDGADALELGADAVAAGDGELPREGAGHDVVAGLQSAAIGGQLARQPGDRAQRMSEHGVAASGAHLGPVDADPRADRREIEVLAQLHRGADHEKLLLCVVGQRQRELAGEVAARLDDLQRRMTAVHRAGDVVDPELGAREIPAQHDTDLVLEARLAERVVTEGVTARDAPLAQQAAEDGLVHLELLLDRLGREPDFPADVRHTRRAAARDETELDAVRIVEVEPTLPGRREEDAALALRPELVDHPGQRRPVHAHAASSGGSSTTRVGSSASPTTLPTFGAVGSRALRTAPDSSATSTSYSRP